MIKEQKNNTIEVLTGLIVLLAAIFFFLFSFYKSDLSPGLSRNDFILTASFESVDGLRVGNAVLLAGVKVGSVNTIELDREIFSAVVTVTLFDDYELPDDTEAAITTDGLFGDKQIKLTAGGSPILLESGDEILFTQGSLNIINLLNKFSSK
jgi:phospholipid/cholesterol/gamma-HCH transport system substrate-binding protein